MKKIKVLFVNRSGEKFLYCRSFIQALLERGHSVRMLIDKKWTESTNLLAGFQKANSNFDFTYDWAVQRSDRWRLLLFYTRELSSYRWYLTVQKNQSSYYRDRWKSYLPDSLQTAVAQPAVAWLLRTALVGGLLKLIEKIAPADRRISADIAKDRPDVCIASPGNLRFSSSDLEYLKAAAALGIPTAVPVVSWDNLTTKGLFHIKPDLLLAWNTIQSQEATSYHAIADANIKITGSPFFDHWFIRPKPLSRQKFCAQHGLRSKDLIFLYLGSSKNIATNEVWLIQKIWSALRNSDNPKLRTAQMIIRPHPANCDIYNDIGEKDIIVLPKDGTLPNTADDLQLFSDSLQHTALALGINTSAMLEAIIVDKPVISVLAKEYQRTQELSQHFQHLLKSETLYLVENPELLASAITDILAGKDPLKEKRLNFVRSFIRPRGLDQSAGIIITQEIEDLVI